MDDDPGLRKTLSDILRLQGYPVISIENGQKALDIISNEYHSIALVDLKLEDICGLALMEKIKQISPSTECILITGHATRISAIEALNIGAYGYLEKPYNIDQLLLMLQRAIEKIEVAEALAQERSLLAKRVEERTQELRLANAELARAARLKDEFLASMSHELRTPLNAILGLTEALADEVYGPLNEKQLKSLKRVESSGRHLLSLITDILDISKIEAGKFELEIGPVSVASVCQASLQMIKQTASKKNITVENKIDHDIRIIQADDRRLKQILVNLLSNAVKFTPEFGKIRLEVRGDQEQHIVHFSVIDNGIGIDRSKVDQLFKPFIQLDSSLSRHYEGTGLGLALVSRLTEMHGGRVFLETALNEGSRFTVSLPWNSFSSNKNEPSSKDSEPI